MTSDLQVEKRFSGKLGVLGFVEERF